MDIQVTMDLQVSMDLQVTMDRLNEIIPNHVCLNLFY